MVALPLPASTRGEIAGVAARLAATRSPHVNDPIELERRYAHRRLEIEAAVARAEYTVAWLSLEPVARGWSRFLGDESGWPTPILAMHSRSYLWCSVRRVASRLPTVWRTDMSCGAVNFALSPSAGLVPLSCAVSFLCGA